jgi:hypothetical protein
VLSVRFFGAPLIQLIHVTQDAKIIKTGSADLKERIDS